jgi:O-antigen/teichoic acid export membrane protein
MAEPTSVTQRAGDRRRGVRAYAVAVLGHAGTTVLAQLAGAVIALLVVRLASPVLWGEFVAVLIFVHLGAHVAGWGNKEFLVRAFSRAPGGTAAVWQTSLATRLVLFALMALPWSLLFPTGLRWLALGWMLAATCQQAFDAAVVHRRRFLLVFLLEAAGAAMLIAVVMSAGSGLTVTRLVVSFLVVQAGKAIVLATAFRRLLLPAWLGRVDPRHLVAASPFFLLGVSGLLQSRVDLYVVDRILSSHDVGMYLVLANALLLLQSGANFLLVPVLQDVYTLSWQYQRRIARRLLLAGLALVPPGLVAIHWALTRLYLFEVSWQVVAVGALVVLPVYAHLPLVYRLYRTNREHVVLRVSVAGIAINLALSIVLVPRLGILGALVAAGVTKCVAMGAYVAVSRASHDAAATATASGQPPPLRL